MSFENKSTIILSILICIIFSSCGHKKIVIQKGKYLYEWENLPYHNQTEAYIVNQFGNPDKINDIKIYNNDKRSMHPLYLPLIRFLPVNKDTIIIKELYWKQDSYLIYYWLIKKDSVWTSVDGIMYDPKYVEF